MTARTLSIGPALLALLLGNAAAAAPNPKPKAPPPAKTQTAADPSPAPAPTGSTTAGSSAADAPAYNSAGVAIVGGFFGLLILGVGAAALVARARSGGAKPSGGGRGDGRPPEPILAKREYDWELRLTEEQERAMLRGIEAYRDAGHGLYIYHEDALILFYRPYLLVSLSRLTDDFLAAGPAGVADPVSTVRAIFQGYVAAPSPGVLHHTNEWYRTPLGGLDHARCGALFYDLLTKPKPYLPGTHGSSLDENTGQMVVKVKVDGRINVFCVSLGVVLDEVHKGQAANPSVPLVDLVRGPLIAIAHGALPGGMWTRGAPSSSELALVERIVTTSAPRAG